VRLESVAMDSPCHPPCSHNLLDYGVVLTKLDNPVVNPDEGVAKLLGEPEKWRLDSTSPSPWTWTLAQCWRCPHWHPEHIKYSSPCTWGFNPSISGSSAAWNLLNRLKD
jgi:hypothetical protein